MNHPASRCILEGRIALLEAALAEYAHRYGLTEQARVAFRASLPERAVPSLEAPQDDGTPKREP